MKKLIMLLALMAFACFAAIAEEPVVVEANTVGTGSVVADDFSNVQGVSIGDSEAQETDGEGVVGAIFGAITGAVVSVCNDIGAGRDISVSNALWGAAGGAVTGFITNGGYTITTVARGIWGVYGGAVVGLVQGATQR